MTTQTLNADPDAEPRDASVRQPNRWLILAAMTGSLSMIFLDTTIVSVALPTMRSSLGIGESGAQWVMNAYTLTLASLVALGGRFGDAIGRVRCFIGGVALFALASVACGLAQGEPSLVIARALQGLAAALMQPASSAIVISAFAPGERGRAMGVYVGVSMAFLALGPVLGGLLTEFVSWRACFLINVPVAAAAIWLTLRARPADAGRDRPEISLPRTLLYLAGLPALVFGLQEGGTWGWQSPWVQVPIVAGLALVVLFVVLEWRRAHPLLHVRLFADRGFAGDAVVLFCMQFAMTGQVIYMGDYLQRGLGFEPASAGAALLPLLIPVLVVVHIAGRWYDRTGPRAPVLLGTALACAGLLLLAAVSTSGHYFPVALGLAVLGTGIGFAMTPINTDALSRAPAALRGQASGLLGTARQIAASTGIAVVGAAILLAQRRLQASGIATPERLAVCKATAIGQVVSAGSIGLALLAALFLVPRRRIQAEPESEAPAR